MKSVVGGLDYRSDPGTTAAADGEAWVNKKNYPQEKNPNETQNTTDHKGNS